MPSKNFLTTHQFDVHFCTEFLCTVCRPYCPSRTLYRKRADTVGELKSAEICVSHLPSKKAKKLGKLTQEKVLLEL
jgi:Pyruvate/2-oxoacid:ferredoxin oxidoreductase delta subunit